MWHIVNYIIFTECVSHSSHRVWSLLLLLAVMLALGAHMVSLYDLGVGCHPVTCIICPVVDFLDSVLALASVGLDWLLLAIPERSHGWHNNLAQRVEYIQWVGVGLV